MEHSATTNGGHSDGSQTADLAIVGAGLSGSWTLLSLIGKWRDNPPARRQRVVLFERSERDFGGLAYGDRVSRNSLIITSLRDFLPDAQRAEFATWLSANKATVFDRMMDGAGERCTKWQADHAAQIAGDDFDDIFFPRYLYGVYLRDVMNAAVTEAEAAGWLTFDLRQAEVVDVRSTSDGGNHLICDDDSTLDSTHVVLALGTPPTLPRFGHADEFAAAGLTMVDDPYGGGLTSVVESIDSGLRSQPSDRRNVLIIGGNASTMELLFLIADLGAEAREGSRIWVITPRGKLPQRLVPPTPGVAFQPEALATLAGASRFTAQEIHDAARADIDRGDADGLTIADTMLPIAGAFSALVGRLDPAEKAEFSSHWGVMLGRYQRRAGEEYYDVVDTLTQAGRFEVVAGRFTGVSEITPDGALVDYESDDGTPGRLAERMQVVVNCSGFARVDDPAAGPLLVNLLASGRLRPTAHFRGLLVDDQMSVGGRMYMTGPMLAGNVVNELPIWHMEHAGRVMAFADRLSATLAESLRASESPALA